MSKIEKLKKLLDKTKYNKSAIDTLKKGSKEEEELIQQLLEAGGEKPLTQNPFQGALGNIDVSALPKQADPKAFILGQGSDVIPETVKLPPKSLEKHLPVPYDDTARMASKLEGVDLPAGPQSLQAKFRQMQEMAANNKGKLATGLGAGAVLNLNLNQSVDDMINPKATAAQAAPAAPVAPPVQEAETPEEAQIRKELASMSASIPGGTGSSTPTVIDFGEGESIASAEKLKQIYEQRDKDLRYNDLARIISSLPYVVTGDKSGPYDAMYDEKAKRIMSSPDDYQNQVKFEKEDPNSPISKGYKALAKSMGFDIQGTASAADIEKQFPQLANIYNQKNAQASRAQDLKMRLAEMKTSKNEAKALKDDTFVQGLRKEVTAGSLGKMFNNYNTAKRMETALEQFTKNPSAYSDYATLMGGLKALQGDESVVREAEMRLGMSATSLGNKVQNWSDRLISGKSLQPDQRKEMVDTIRILSESAKKQYMDAIQPIMSQAEQRGINPKFLVGEEMRQPSPQQSAPVGASGLTPEQRRKRILELQGKK